MSRLLLRAIPRRWRNLPARSARLRLTLMYSGMFLLLGTAVVVIISALVLGGGLVSVSQTVATAAPRAGGSTVQHVVTHPHATVQVRLLGVAWLVLVFTVIASLPLGWLAAGRVLRPLRQMTAAARTISAGSLHERLALAGPSDEFKQLGDTFDDLLARLEAAFAAQRRFVANAAHELRTPLTLERTLLQVALADPDATAAALRATCEELVESGRNQERLLDALLTLATSERGLEHHELFDLAPLVERVLADAEPDIARRQLQRSAALAPAVVMGDRALVHRLIANLIDNAVVYNEAGGRFHVETGTKAGQGMLSVTNSGPQIPRRELGRLFEPFQRLGTDRVDSDGHHGLGLSIARAIAIAHDATVTAEPQPAGGLAVTVTFPAQLTAAHSAGPRHMPAPPA